MTQFFVAEQCSENKRQEKTCEIKIFVKILNIERGVPKSGTVYKLGGQ